MKIGLLVDQLNPGGVQNIAFEEVKNFNKLGVDAELLVLMRNEKETHYQEEIESVPVRFLSDEYPRFFKKGWKIPVFNFLNLNHFLAPYFVARILEPGEYDAIISQNTTTSFTAQRVKQKVGIPYFPVIWDPMPYILRKVYSRSVLRPLFPVLEPYLKLREKAYIKHATEILAGSRVHEKFTISEYGIKPTVIHPGSYPWDKFCPDKEMYFTAFTRWENIKRPYFLLEILRNFPELKLKMGGAWSNQEHYKGFVKRIKGFGLEKRVEINTYMDSELMRRLASRALFWIHPNFEGFGMGGLESAGFGCPIIIPRGSGVTELFESGVHGFFPKRMEMKDVRGFISELIKDPGKSTRMGLAAQEVANQNDWRAHTEKILHLIKEKKTYDGNRISN